MEGVRRLWIGIVGYGFVKLITKYGWNEVRYAVKLLEMLGGTLHMSARRHSSKPLGYLLRTKKQETRVREIEFFIFVPTLCRKNYS